MDDMDGRASATGHRTSSRCGVNSATTTRSRLSDDTPASRPSSSTLANRPETGTSKSDISTPSKSVSREPSLATTIQNPKSSENNINVPKTSIVESSKIPVPTTFFSNTSVVPNAITQKSGNSTASTKQKFTDLTISDKNSTSYNSSTLQSNNATNNSSTFDYNPLSMSSSNTSINTQNLPMSFFPVAPTFSVYVETLTGAVFEVVCSPFEPVVSIKEKIYRLEGIPISKQHLIYNGSELKQDDAALGQLGIAAESKLTLVLDIRGGPINTQTVLRTPQPRRLQLSDITHYQINDSTPPAESVEKKSNKHRADIIFSNLNGNAMLIVFDCSSQNNASTQNDTSSDDNQDSLNRQSLIKSTSNLIDDTRMNIKMRQLRQKMLEKKYRKAAKAAASSAPKVDTHVQFPALNSSTRTGKSSNTNISTAYRQNFVSPNIIKHDHESFCNRYNLTSPRESKTNYAPEPPSYMRRDHSRTSLEKVLMNSSTDPQDLDIHRDYVYRSRSKHRTPTLPPIKPPLRSFPELPTKSPSPPNPPMAPNSSTARLKLRALNGLKPLLSDEPTTTPQQTFPNMFITNTLVRQELSTASSLKSKKHKPSKKLNRLRCEYCRKRISMGMEFVCRCQMMLCAKCRIAEAHLCKFDYKQIGRQTLKKENPLVTAHKLPKID